MTTRAKKSLKRSKKRAKRRQLKQRAAVQHEASRSTVITQNHPGYDVVMIRDFLEHLLLELRVQQYENVRALRSLRSCEDFEEAKRVAAETSPTLIEQLKKYHLKYSTSLLPANVIDGEGATDKEVKDFVEAFLTHNIEVRDAEIGHLEALQDVIDEALLTAKLPCGLTQDRQVVLPQRVHRVREFLDEQTERNVPPYEDLLPEFEDHPLATELGIEKLKRSRFIAAHSEKYDDYLLLYRHSDSQRLDDNGDEDASVLCFRVDSYRQLQFVISAIRKFVGPPLTDGTPWEEL